MKKLISIMLVMLFCCRIHAQDSLGTSISYTVGAETAVGSGEYNAYQMVTNRYSTLGVRSNTANVRAAVELEHRFTDRYVLTAKVDGIASVHADHKAYLQQCYVNMKLNHFYVEAGMREVEPLLRDRRLTSGDFVESGNAKPLPQVRLGTNGFWTVPFTKQWLEIYLDGSYGRYLDGAYNEDVAMKNGYNYCTGRWHHQKQFYFRSNSSKRVYFMAGIHHVAQFGGLFHTYDGSTPPFQADLTPGIKDFFKILIPKGSDATGEWISGNHLGTYTFQLSWNIDRSKQLHAYLDNIFEDGSGMRKGNGYDGVWGLEYRNRAEGVQYLRGAVFEYVQTTHQSGYIHWDHNDYPYPYNSISGMQDLVTGNDNYYNNYFYVSYANYGVAQGNGLLMSPVYNKDGFGGFADNTIKAYHLGVEGDICKGRQGDFAYLVRGSYRTGWGTHGAPLAEKSHSFDALVQVDWAKGPLKASAAYAFDRGNIYGNNNTFNLSISYNGKIL